MQNLQSLNFLLHSFMFCEILSVSSSDTCSKRIRNLETYGMLVARFIRVVLLII